MILQNFTSGTKGYGYQDLPITHITFCEGMCFDKYYISTFTLAVPTREDNLKTLQECLAFLLLHHKGQEEVIPKLIDLVYFIVLYYICNKLLQSKI